MAGVITHLYLGELIYKNISDKIDDKSGYYLGTIAPDAVMSKDNYNRDDKKESHLRIGISSDDWYLDEYNDLFNSRINIFFSKYIKDNNNSFALGYLVHLLTDQAFHFSFRKDITEKLKRNSLPNKGKYLLKVMINELDSLDYKLLNENKKIYNIIKGMNEVCSEYSLNPLISSVTLCKNFKWINEKYLSEIDKCRFTLCNEEDLESFLENIEKEVLVRLNKLFEEGCYG